MVCGVSMLIMKNALLIQDYMETVNGNMMTVANARTVLKLTADDRIFIPSSARKLVANKMFDGLLAIMKVLNNLDMDKEEDRAFLLRVRILIESYNCVIEDMGETLSKYDVPNSDL